MPALTDFHIQQTPTEYRPQSSCQTHQTPVYHFLSTCQVVNLPISADSSINACATTTAVILLYKNHQIHPNQKRCLLTEYTKSWDSNHRNLCCNLKPLLCPCFRKDLAKHVLRTWYGSIFVRQWDMWHERGLQNYLCNATAASLAQSQWRNSAGKNSFPSERNIHV